MKTTKNLNVYLANLEILNVKVKNLHWNLEGNKFYQIHTFLDTVYETISEYLDEVAEIERMYGDYPIASLKQYIEIGTIKEETRNKFESMEALKIVLQDLRLMRKQALDLRVEADNEGWFALVNMLEDQISYYDKTIWMASATLV